MGNLVVAIVLVAVLAVWHRTAILDALGAWFAGR
jgi:hypothetical protein